MAKLKLYLSSMEIGNEKKIPCLISSFTQYPKNDIILKNCVKKYFKRLQLRHQSLLMLQQYSGVAICRENCYYHHHISKITTIMIIKVSIIITIVSSSRS